MKRRKLFLISNPSAGGGRGRRANEVERFGELLKHHDIEVEPLYTSGPSDAGRLAERAVTEGASDVVVLGGDGTINEALQRLVGADVSLGVWARGTANVLARELGLPFGAKEMAEVIARGRIRRIHIGCATREETGERRYFLLMAGIGLDASIVYHVHPGLKKRIGKGAFWYSGLGHLAHWQPVPFHIEVEGETHTATFAAIGNGSRYGGDLAITPRARLDEPDFEVCLISSNSRLRYLYLLTSAIRGGASQEGQEGIRFLRASRVRATGDVPVQVDGELLGRLPMTFEIVPQTINVIVP